MKSQQTIQTALPWRQYKTSVFDFSISSLDGTICLQRLC